MATVNITTPKIITFEFRQEKTDEDYGSCMWARFNLDLINYSMSIESDCGNYGYGWIPTPETESFLKLCARFDAGYLLCKISDTSVVDGKKTWENLEEIIKEVAECLTDEQDEDMEEIKNACYSGYNERDVHDAVESAIKYTRLENEIEDFDLWDSIEKDYPINAKKIVEVYITHIVPAIKKMLTEMECKNNA